MFKKCQVYDFNKINYLSNNTNPIAVRNKQLKII